MATLTQDLTEIEQVENKLVANKLSRFAYTEEAYDDPLQYADGVENYDVNNAQNIPVGTTSVMKVNETVVSKGYRSQASSLTRMLMNHFLGRTSYNLNKVNDNLKALLATFKGHLGTANGIATLDAGAKLPFAQLPFNMETVGFHNSIYGGRKLNAGEDTDVSVEDFCTQVREKGFHSDVYVGDYWEFDGKKFRVAEFDAFYNQGDLISDNASSGFSNRHHAVIVPDENLSDEYWGTSGNTNTGYAGSSAFTTELPRLADIYNDSDFFDGYILHKKEYFSSQCTNGKVTGATQKTAQMVLMNCIELFGSAIYTFVNTDTITNVGASGVTHQLALFRFNPQLISQQNNYFWLRDIYAGIDNGALYVSGYGGCVGNVDVDGDEDGFRPRFLIG